MAKINGISIKKLVEREDHEGCAMYACDIYLNGKFIGTYSQNYMCGPTEVNLIPEYSLKLLNQKIVELNHENNEILNKKEKWDCIEPFYALEKVVEDLIELKYFEKNFKQTIKKINLYRESKKDISDCSTKNWFVTIAKDRFNEAFGFCKEKDIQSATEGYIKQAKEHLSFFNDNTQVYILPYDWKFDYFTKIKNSDVMSEV